ncbi:MAG: hypothetical protein JWQ28_1225 [Pedobacter sp.]|jgi:hypothetical protein|nr:hypothetical protein [Pedobacter sp.]
MLPKIMNKIDSRMRMEKSLTFFNHLNPRKPLLNLFFTFFCRVLADVKNVRRFAFRFKATL